MGRGRFPGFLLESMPRPRPKGGEEPPAFPILPGLSAIADFLSSQIVRITAINRALRVLPINTLENN